MDRLTQIRNFSPDDIKDLISELGLLIKLPTTSLDSLDDKDCVICLRATLPCYYATDGTKIPREMQLRVVLADQHGKDLSQLSAESKVVLVATGFQFCDSGLCEVPRAEERERTWVSYERGGIVVDARSTNVQRSSPFLWRCIRFWKRDADTLPK